MTEMTETTMNTVPSDPPRVVSFENIDPRAMAFSDLFKCAKSSAGQIVQGFDQLRKNLNGVDEYNGNKKEPTNDYQKLLYPKMALLAENIVNKYVELFVDGVTDPVRKQVFGANLNGNKNDGQLNKFVTCRSVNQFLRYKYSQFGQLLSLLNYRLLFIAHRDPQYIKRYTENEVEMHHFEDLRVLCGQFCEFLKNENDQNSISQQWAQCVEDIRTNVPKVMPRETDKKRHVMHRTPKRNNKNKNKSNNAFSQIY